MFTEPVLCRGRHGQESEEGKEDREGSHQESGKEDFKEKEVVASTAGIAAMLRREPAGPLARASIPELSQGIQELSVWLLY
jgi:hypothetical protein